MPVTCEKHEMVVTFKGKFNYKTNIKYQGICTFSIKATKSSRLNFKKKVLPIAISANNLVFLSLFS